MVMPTPIFRQFIMVETDFTLGRFEVHLDAPALTSSHNELCKSYSLIAPNIVPSPETTAKNSNNQ
jgi:hypothetical protein